MTTAYAANLSHALQPEMAEILAPCMASGTILYGRTKNDDAKKTMKEVVILAEEQCQKYAGKEECGKNIKNI